MNTNAFETYESVVRSYCRHFPKVFTEATGAVIKDEDGQEYIDFFCGAGAVKGAYSCGFCVCGTAGVCCCTAGVCGCTADCCCCCGAKYRV